MNEGECAWWDSNPRPQPPQGCALSTELQALKNKLLLMAPAVSPGTWMGFGAEGGSRTHTPFQALRPERSASTISPLRHSKKPLHAQDRAARQLLAGGR
jgi:hypothetical protein